MNRYASLGLQRDPFSTTPDLAFMAPALGQTDALSRLSDLVETRLGFGVVTGEHGLGKTLVRQALARGLGRERAIALATLAAGMDSTTDVTFLRTVATALDSPAAGRTSLDLTTEITSRLVEIAGDERWPVVLIDDAHLLTSTQLELVRTIAGGEDEENQATIILFGEPELVERIARRKTLSKRLALRHTLNPVNRQDAAGLLQHRLRTAGVPEERELFTPRATERLVRRARGNPRDLIELAGRCLDEAVAIGVDAIDTTLVDRVLFGAERGVASNQLGLFDGGEQTTRGTALSGARKRSGLDNAS
jgi:type II secretory pathway predicted ATPase ExeA